MFSDPVKNLRALGVGDANIVADLGAGTGFYTIIAAKMVPLGRVYAVDLHKEFLPTIKAKARDAGLTNVECIWGDIERVGGTKIGDKVVDTVIASNVLFQLEQKDKFVEEAKRILKQNGKLLFIDWSDHQPLAKHLIPKEQAKELFLRKGFNFERDIPAGEHHYGMIFRKP